MGAPIARRWRTDRRGTVAVEFGLIGVPFFMTLFAVFEIGFSFFQSSALEHATQEGARQVMTGAVSTSGMTAAQFKSQVICPALPSTFDCNSVFVNLSIVPNGQNPTGFYSYVNATSSGLKQPALNNSTTQFCPGAGTQYVVLQILYPLSFLTTFLSAGVTTTYGGKTVHVLMSTAAFKSEPYAGATSYAGC